MWAIDLTPLSSTVDGLISDTGKPEVPKTETRMRSRCWVSMIRCSCGLIRIGGDGSGFGFTGVTGSVAWASVKVFSGKKASPMCAVESLPANAPIPITLEGVKHVARLLQIKLREVCDRELEVRVGRLICEVDVACVIGQECAEAGAGIGRQRRDRLGYLDKAWEATDWATGTATCWMEAAAG